MKPGPDGEGARLVDERLRAWRGWRAETLTAMRRLIHEATFARGAGLPDPQGLSTLAAMAAAAMALACGDAASPPAPATPQWQGEWNGVEGTFLRLVLQPGGRYRVIVKNLDGERSFDGVAHADHIVFERDGVQERLRATDGAGTGMKWLADKSTCLTVRAGEGYCRD